MDEVVPKPWSQRTFVVSGGCSGIGMATVVRLLELSSTVYIIDIVPKLPESLRMAQYSGKLHFIPEVDVSSRQAVATAFQIIFQAAENIDGLVNCAGVSPSSGEILDTDETFNANISINLVGTWNVATEILRRLQERQKQRQQKKENGSTSEAYKWIPGVSGKCSIVNIGSTASYQGYSTMGAYVASKHAVLGLTRTWALDFAPLGVRVTLVAPGITRTPLLEVQFDKTERGDMAQQALEKTPLRRLADPSETAHTIIFLLSNESSFTTGQVLSVSGGYP